MATRRGVSGLALLLIALLLSAQAVRADIAATGSFNITLSGLPPTVPFSGDIFFDEGTRTALGSSVDMDTDVGDMSFAGTAAVDTVQESATFSLSAQSVDDTDDFQFTASGAGRCEQSGCAGGTGTFAGRFVTIADPDDVLPDGIYTFDGTADINFLGQGPGGVFAINAFPGILTTVGTDKEVSSGAQTFFDTVQDAERNFVATARFASVTGEGNTEFVAFSALPGDFPAGVNFNAMVALFVDVSTNAMVGAGVRLCLSYPDSNPHDGIVDGTINNISETRLRLLHATSIGQAFTDVTVSVGDERVCGDADAVGPITIGILPAGATTTTSTSSTTSSLAPGATTSTSTTGPSSSTTTTSSTLPSGATTTSTTRPSAASTTTTIVVSPSGSTTTSTTLPVCATALDCLDLAIAGPLCPGEAINQKLAATILKKLTKAETALRGAQATTVAKKAAKLIGKAKKQLDKIEAKADAFASKPAGKGISSACRDRIHAAVGLVSQQIEASRI